MSTSHNIEVSFHIDDTSQTQDLNDLGCLIFDMKQPFRNLNPRNLETSEEILGRIRDYYQRSQISEEAKQAFLSWLSNMQKLVDLATQEGEKREVPDYIKAIIAFTQEMSTLSN